MVSGPLDPIGDALEDGEVPPAGCSIELVGPNIRRDRGTLELVSMRVHLSTERKPLSCMPACNSP